MVYKVARALIPGSPIIDNITSLQSRVWLCNDVISLLTTTGSGFFMASEMAIPQSVCVSTVSRMPKNFFSFSVRVVMGWGFRLP
jgi:hypothetical protein